MSSQTDWKPQPFAASLDLQDGDPSVTGTGKHGRSALRCFGDSPNGLVETEPPGDEQGFKLSASTG